MSRSNRERAHSVPLARRVAGKSGASPGGRESRVPGRIDQLNVPCWVTTGADAGADITAPPSSQQAPPAGAPQAGPQAGSQTGAWHGSDCLPQGERNSMNEGRRQLEPPKQLLQPGAAARAARAIARHMERVMTCSPTAGGGDGPGLTGGVVRDDAMGTLAHDPGAGRGAVDFSGHPAAAATVLYRLCRR
jgi:hypothetical protein